MTIASFSFEKKPILSEYAVASVLFYIGLILQLFGFVVGGLQKFLGIGVDGGGLGLWSLLGDRLPLTGESWGVNVSPSLGIAEASLGQLLGLCK